MCVCAHVPAFVHVCASNSMHIQSETSLFHVIELRNSFSVRYIYLPTEPSFWPR